MSKSPNKSRRGRPPLTPEMRKRTLPVMFDPRQLSAIEDIAAREGITRGEVVRVLVMEALNARKVKRSRGRA